MRARAAVAAAVVAMAVAATAREARADLRVGGVVVIRSDGDHDYHGGHDGRYDDRSGRQGPAFRYGFDRGWREGSDEGYRDARHNHDPRFWREGEFRDGDRGYKGWMGPRWDYSNGFRDGYRAGYRRAYASARPAWRGRWENYGWGASSSNGGRYPSDARDAREDERRREYERSERGRYPDSYKPR